MSDFRKEVLVLAATVEAEKRLKALRADMRKAGFKYFSINKGQPDFSDGDKHWANGHMYARGHPNNGSAFWDLLRKHKIHMGCGNGSRGKNSDLHQAQLAYWPYCSWDRVPEDTKKMEEIIQQEVLMKMPSTEWDLTKKEPR